MCDFSLTGRTTLLEGASILFALQTTCDKDPIRVFHQTTVANLGKTEYTFNDQECILNFGTHTRFTLVRHFLIFSQRMIAYAASIGEVKGFRHSLFAHLLLSNVRRKSLQTRVSLPCNSWCNGWLS